MQPDLTTVDRVQSYLRDKSPDSSRTTLKTFVRVASRLIRSHTKRRFTAPRVTETRIFRTYDHDTVHIDEVFSPGDIKAVVDDHGMGLAFDLDFDERNLPVKGADLILSTGSRSLRGGLSLPHDHADHFIRELRGGYGSYVPPYVSVTAQYGYSDPEDDMNGIPPEVVFAATRVCAIWFREDASHLTEDAFISRGQKFEPDSLPPIAIAMLRDWINEDEVAI